MHNVERDVSNSWIGELKFFIDGQLYHYYGRITMNFFNDFQGVEIKTGPSYFTRVQTFEFKKMYLIQFVGQKEYIRNELKRKENEETTSEERERKQWIENVQISSSLKAFERFHTRKRRIK